MVRSTRDGLISFNREEKENESIAIHKKKLNEMNKLFLRLVLIKTR